MNAGNEVTAAEIEATFGQHGSSARFANFCNAVLVTESTGTLPSAPILSEKPGADGGFDGEWDLSAVEIGFTNTFTEVGWNVFQYKGRGVSGSGSRKAISEMKSTLKGALSDLVPRLKTKKNPARYVLFTNLQLGLKTESTTERGAELSTQRAEIEAAIREGSDLPTTVVIIDAAQLAAIVNKHPALRLTYFEPSVARSWSEEWEREKVAKGDKVFIPIVGREKEMEQLQAWIADPVVKVIAICGPSGMGKTRTALEATRIDHLRTTFVDNVEELERLGAQALDTSSQPRLIIVEDPTENQADRLAKQAVSTQAVKFVFTFPSEAKAPQLKLTEHEAVKQMQLEPLNRDPSQKLLELAGAKLDTVARDWIIQQAGGIPVILLSVVELGSSLRDQSGDLRRRLADAYRKRLDKELGINAVGTLRILSPLHWIAVSGTKGELAALVASIGQGLTPSDVTNFLSPLEKLGYLRRRGDYVSVVPPLFAAALAEELFDNDPQGVCKLFDKLGDQSRKRLLERAVTTELSDQAALWNHVFEAALGTTELLIANLDLLDYLARAIPLRTARFLASQIGHFADALHFNQHGWKESTLLSIFRELAYNQESSHLGVQLLETMAMHELETKKPRDATRLFCECFVHWYSEFPLSYQERETWIRRLLKSTVVLERELAVRVIVTVTAPPHSLSGYSGNARRLGQRPPSRLWTEVYDYLENCLDLRLGLTQDSDPKIAKLAQEHYVRCFQEVELPPDRQARALQKFTNCRETGAVRSDDRELRQVLHWVERRYREVSKRPDQLEHVEKWKPVLESFEAMRRQLDEGPFELRLRIALGPSFDHEWEEVDGKRIYASEKRCLSLAAEAVKKPEIMDETAFKILREPGANNAHTFLIALGDLDRSAAFLSRFESDATDHQGGRNLGLYLHGRQRNDAPMVERELERLVGDPVFPKELLPTLIVLTGPTTGNRRRLLELISKEAVEPLAVGGLFTVGRWLDDLPPTEVCTILEFVAKGPPDWQRLTLDVISLYLHDGRPLPTELLPVAEQALHSVVEVDDNLRWHCEHVAIGIAKSDLEKGLELLRMQIAAFKATDPVQREVGGGWRVFRSHGTNEFWEFLRTQAPERAYRELLLVGEAKSKSQLGLPLELEKHRDVLLTIAAESETNALLLAELATGSQANFFQFAYGLMEAYPGQAKIASRLGSAAIYGVGGGWGDWDYSQALSKVEAEIKSTTTPKRFAPWLEDLRCRLKAAAKKRPTGDFDDFHLGWD